MSRRGCSPVRLPLPGVPACFAPQERSRDPARCSLPCAVRLTRSGCIRRACASAGVRRSLAPAYASSKRSAGGLARRRLTASHGGVFAGVALGRYCLPPTPTPCLHLLTPDRSLQMPDFPALPSDRRAASEQGQSSSRLARSGVTLHKWLLGTCCWNRPSSR